jgi:hypothetical protein
VGGQRAGAGLKAARRRVDHLVTLFAGRYELGPVIGRGGMAEVRSATDTRLHRPVALKMMWPEAATQPLVRSRFEAEARLAARLSHPNVVSIFDSGEDEGVPFIVMERLSGETLHDRLLAGPMREDDARTMMLEVLAALETAHAAGILHRDIKPANILEAGGHWKVADFGIAKALETDGSDHTATGLVLGTPAYLAPERLFGSPASVPADIFAVGVVAYEALTGSKPFHSDTGGSWPGSMALRPLVPLGTARPGVDPVLARVIETSLDKDPHLRFQSAAEMAFAVHASADPRPTAGAAPTTLVAAAGAPAATRVMGLEGRGLAPAPTSVLGAAAAGRASSGPPEWGPRERRRAGLAALALAALVAVAIGLSSLGGHSSGGPISKRTPTTTAATTTTAPSTTTTSTTVPAPAHAKPPKGPAHGSGPGPGPGADAGGGGDGG